MIAQHDLHEQVLAAQSAFRAIMDATARPGSLQPIMAAPDAPASLNGAVATIVLTLVDQDTPVWLDERLADAPDLADWVRFRTGAPIVREPDLSTFALIGDPARLPAFGRFNQGTAEYPDRSTTLVLQVASFEQGDTMVLTGPGIRGTQPLRAAPLPPDMSARIAANWSLFPRGVDLLLAAPQRIAALPRSVRLKRD
jgi:alpha-D-ribose 1-methylphosphonate 5-triphosphate synthase subunit PhnH